MKRILSLALAVLLLTLSLLSLAACGDLSGKYVSQSGFLTYEFSAKKLVTSDEYTEYSTVYTYEIQKNGSARYIALTLEGYEYDGTDADVSDYVAKLNAALEGKTNEPVRQYFAENEDGTIKIGTVIFVKKD